MTVLVPWRLRGVWVLARTADGVIRIIYAYAATVRSVAEVGSARDAV